MIHIRDQLDYHIISSCNLDCPGCDRFCNYEIPYHISVEDFEKDSSLWGNLCTFDTITLIGGEPFMHPNLLDLYKISLKNFKAKSINIATNGTLFHKSRNINIVDHMLSLGHNTTLEVSIHLNDDNEKRKIFKNIKEYFLKNYKWEKIDSRRLKFKNVLITIKDYTGKDWVWHPYNRFIDGKLKPYNDKNPKLSWERCSFADCVSIFKGRMYKCARLALLGHYLEKYNSHKDPDWAPYYKYKGICPSDDVSIISDFIAKREVYEEVCNMCPAYELAVPQRGANYK